MRAPGFFLRFFLRKGYLEILPGADGFFNELLSGSVQKLYKLETNLA